MSRESYISKALEATDDLIKWIIADDDRLNDESLAEKLSELRKEHKQTQRVIESLYKDAQTIPAQNSVPARTRKTELLYGDLFRQDRQLREAELEEAYYSMTRRRRDSVESNCFEVQSTTGSFIGDSFLPDNVYDEETHLRSARSILLCEEDFIQGILMTKNCVWEGK